MPDVPSLEDLVRAICEGTPIDWDSLARDASPGFGHKLAALRLVESVARVHHRAPAPGDQAVPAVTSAPLHWGHLELIEHVASGAFGDVYRAWDPGLDREVALKLLKSADADISADEAVDEGRMLARLHHPNIVTVHGAARHDGRVGIWMEYVRGRTLTEVVRQEGPMSVDRVTAIGIALCESLGAVHAAQLVHRDIKGQNVMLTAEGRVVLMDFGAGRDRLHAALDLAGTPAYLAPEVARGEEPTARSDIYSLGVTLRYLLTGSLALSALKGRAEGRLLATVARATNVSPDQRFESTQAFAAALESVAKPRWNVVAMALAASLVLLSFGILWTTLRPGNVGESSRRALETSWQAAIPTRAPLTPDQFQRLSISEQGTFSFHGTLPATTALTTVATSEQSVVTFDPRSGDIRVWFTYSTAAGRAGPVTVSPDNSQVAYVWEDGASGRVSLRTIDHLGKIRTLVSGDLVSMVGGASASSVLPLLIGHRTAGFELAVVDLQSGVKQTLRTLSIEPKGVSLSPDGRFVAFDAPRGSQPGSPREIVVHEVSSAREWPLLDTAGDRALPVWSPYGDELFYRDSSQRAPFLAAVRVVDGHRVSQPAVLRRDIETEGMGFVDDETFAYWVGTGRSDVMVVEAAADGTFRGQQPRRIGEGSMMPAWSPDAKWLAWSDFRPRSGGIRVAGRDGKVVRAFHPTFDVQVTPAWSADSRQLAFFDTGRDQFVVKVANVETGETREVLRSQTAGWFTLAWLPGGRELLFSHDGRDIVALDVASSRQREIHVAPSGDQIGSFYVSPDGRSLVFCEGHDEPAPIHVIPLSPGGLELVLPASKADGEALAGWWPDGSLFETRNPSHPAGPSVAELWRRPLNGSRLEPLGVTGSGIIYASVAGDGKRIAYGTQTWGRELWLLKPNDSR